MQVPGMLQLGNGSCAHDLKPVAQHALRLTTGRTDAPTEHGRREQSYCLSLKQCSKPT